MKPVEAVETFLQPVRKTVTVERSIEATFEIFTARISSWWPTDRFSISAERVRDVLFEGRVGGLLFEVRDDGERFPWGQVLVWDPPSRVAFTWYPGRAADTAQEVEVRFSATDKGTLVELEHRGWEALGERAEATRDSYVGGWDAVFGGCFLRACLEE